MTYTLTNGTGVTRDADGACIPDDARNADWQAYQAWLAGGNTPNPAPAAPPPVIDGLTFMSRFTDAEYMAVRQAAQSSAQVARWVDTGMILGLVDLAAQTTKDARAGLVTAGLLTQARADVIFS